MRSVTPMRSPSSAGKRSRQRRRMSACTESWMKSKRNGKPASFHSANALRARSTYTGSHPAVGPAIQRAVLGGEDVVDVAPRLQIVDPAAELLGRQALVASGRGHHPP